MKTAIGSTAGKTVGAYIGSTPLAGVYHGDVKLWPDDLWHVSVLRFASDVRTAAMTHAIWRGSVSFEIGGVSYVHGRNMQIADDGLSVSFTGEDRPTYREVKAALGDSMVLNATLNAKELSTGDMALVADKTWQWSGNVPVAPCSIGASVNVKYSVGSAYKKKHLCFGIYKNEVTSENHLFYYDMVISQTEDYEGWVSSDVWSDNSSKMIMRVWAGTNSSYINGVYWIVLKFKAFSYAKQYSVTSIE